MGYSLRVPPAVPIRIDRLHTANMPRQTEPNANNALGSLLQEMLPGRQVWSENTQAITGHAGLRPDIIVTAPGRSPVVIEAEYVPWASLRL